MNLDRLGRVLQEHGPAVYFAGPAAGTWPEVRRHLDEAGADWCHFDLYGGRGQSLLSTARPPVAGALRISGEEAADVLLTLVALPGERPKVTLSERWAALVGGAAAAGAGEGDGGPAVSKC